MPDRIGVAIIGTGQRGLNCHAKNFLEQGEDRTWIAGLCDPNPANLARARERYPEAPHYGPDYETVIDNSDVDAVVVASPNFLHDDQAVFAFDTGKHVFCEKPLSTTLEGCQRILGAAGRSGRVLEVGFVLRYAPVFVQVKQLIESGEIGAPLLFDWSIHYRGGVHYYRTWHRLKQYSGGLNVEKACHDYDLLNWYFGELPTRVAMWSGLNKFVPGTKKGERCDSCPEPCEDKNAQVRGEVTGSTPDGSSADGTSPIGCFYNTPKDIGDHYIGMMEYESGLRGTVQLCFYPSSQYGRTFTIVGSKGEIRGNLHQRRVELFRRGHGSYQHVFDLTRESEGGHHGGDWRQTIEFLRAIREGGEGLATGADGLRAVAVGVAMERSIEEDRPVRMEEVAEAADLAPGAG